MATRIQWLGHACLLVESDGRRVLIDPFLTGNPKAAARADEVPADLILISHGHEDHVGDAVAIAQTDRGDGPGQLRDRRVAEGARGGLTKVHGLQHGGGMLFDGAIRVKLTPGVPRLDAARGRLRRQPVRLPPDLPRRHADLRRGRHRPLRRHAPDRRGGARPGHPADRRLLHDGPRRRGPRRQAARAEVRPADPLQHVPADRAGRRRLGRPGPSRDPGRARRARARRLVRGRGRESGA